MKIGIDLGGSHIGLGLVDENGNILKKEEKYFNNNNILDIKKNVEEFIYEQVNQILLVHNIEYIGIAIPGTVSDNKIIKAVNLGIENYDLATILKNVLHIDVKLKNDAKCAALAEQKYGELSQYDNSVFLCIGTGIGGAVIYDGKLLEPKNVPGFEISHTIIQKNGLLCNCGKRGCFETYASIKRFKEKLAREFNINSINGEVIRDFIRKNEKVPRLKYLLNNYIEDLSIGISNIINIFEPEAICIGGSFAEYEDILFNPLKQTLLNGNLLFNKRDDIIIKHAKLKNDAGIIGATLI